MPVFSLFKFPTLWLLFSIRYSYNKSMPIKSVSLNSHTNSLKFSVNFEDHRIFTYAEELNRLPLKFPTYRLITYMLLAMLHFWNVRRPIRSSPGTSTCPHRSPFASVWPERKRGGGELEIRYFTEEICVILLRVVISLRATRVGAEIKNEMRSTKNQIKL